MSTTVSASDSPAQIIISENGAPGDNGVTGASGTGLNDIRLSMISNPTCHLFKTNDISSVSAPTNTNSDITWSRATAATYIDRYGVLKYAAIDEPRENSNGFLFEGASTNSLLYSSDFANAAWSKTNTTVTASAATSPDGTTTATELTSTGGITNHILVQNFASATALAPYTVSFFVKANTETSFNLSINQYAPTVDISNADIDMLTGDVSNIVGETPFVEAIADGWLRVSISGVAPAVTLQARILMGGTGAQPDGTSMFIWGGQLEPIDFVTSYIATTSAPASRSSDWATCSFYNNASAAPTSVCFRSKMLGFYNTNGFIFSTGNASTDMFGIVGVGGTESGRFGSQFKSYSGDQLESNRGYSSCYVSSLDKLSVYRDGALNSEVLTIADSIYTNKTLLRFGANTAGGSSSIYGYIADFRVYDFALNANEISYLNGV